MSWGWDQFGQVSGTPQGDDFVAVAAGDQNVVALRADGTLVSWGQDREGVVSGTLTGEDFVAVAAGTAHAVAVRADGSLVSWGWDCCRQVSDTPKDDGYVTVAAGSFHSVALRADGTLVSWGQGSVVRDTPKGDGFVAVATGGSGGEHSVALRKDGTLVAWGRDDLYGQGDRIVSDTPTGDGFVAVAVGSAHSVALRADGTLVSWGRDDWGQVSGTPTGNDFVAVYAGREVSVAQRADGTLVAWGDDRNRQVSDLPAGGGFFAVSPALTVVAIGPAAKTSEPEDKATPKEPATHVSAAYDRDALVVTDSMDNFPTFSATVYAHWVEDLAGYTIELNYDRDMAILKDTRALGDFTLAVKGHDAATGWLHASATIHDPKATVTAEQTPVLLLTFQARPRGELPAGLELPADFAMKLLADKLKLSDSEADPIPVVPERHAVDSAVVRFFGHKVAAQVQLELRGEQRRPEDLEGITVTLRNGTASYTGVFSGRQGDIARYEFVGVAPGENYTIEAGKRGWLAAARSGVAVSGEGDQTLAPIKLTIGDINQDKVIDQVDLDYVTQRLDRRRDVLPAAEQMADVIGDGLVDVFDAVIISRRLNWRYEVLPYAGE